MIPKTIHYCWFGRGPMPELALKCIESWHKYMPDWKYKLWNEDNFDVNSTPYTKEAYEAKKYAFVSDYVRLMALRNEGGVYFDTDVEVFRSFEPLLGYDAFAGFEGSKHIPVGTCVMASKENGEWVNEQLISYKGRHFILDDGTFDVTTNVQSMTAIMIAGGFKSNGQEQNYKDLHVFPVDYFCPRQTTGEYIKTDNTFCEHLGLNSWSDGNKGMKNVIKRLVGQKNMTKIIKLKRKLLG